MNWNQRVDSSIKEAFDAYFAVLNERDGAQKPRVIATMIKFAIEQDIFRIREETPKPAPPPAPAARPAMQGSPLPAPPTWVKDSEKWELWILDFENENYAAERNGEPPKWAITPNPFDGTKH